MSVRGWLPTLVLVVVPIPVLTADAGTQDLESLAAVCTDEGVVSAPRCTELAVIARALQGHLGLLAGMGSEVAGSVSTLGRRLVGSPRVSGSARFAFVAAALPRLGDRVNEPYPETTFLTPSLDAGLTVGVFDGLALMPTVGGFLSLDLFGRAGLLLLPTGEGFEGSVVSLSVGVRVGVLRESFTLPGVSVTASKRAIGRVTLGNTELGDPGAVQLDPNFTSLRATLGKDLFAAGILAGVGWDRYAGAATLSVSSGGTEAQVADDDYVSERLLYFGGVSMNFLILQLSGEFGWASGFDAVDGYRGGPFDPTGGTLFGSIGFRLTI